MATLADLDRRITDIEATLRAAGGLVGVQLCREREKRVMDAVDRLVSSTEDLNRQIGEVRSDIANKRRKDLAILVSLILTFGAVVLGYLMDHVVTG